MERVCERERCGKGEREREGKNPLLLLSALQKNQTGLHVRVGVSEKTHSTQDQDKMDKKRLDSGEEMKSRVVLRAIFGQMSNWGEEKKRKKQKKKWQHCRNRGGDVPEHRCTHGCFSPTAHYGESGPNGRFAANSLSFGH